jgi:hypothetical protein
MKNKCLIVSVVFLVLIVIAPVLALENKPGVSAGQFAEYRTTYKSDTPDDAETLDTRPYWFKMEVLGVSGTKATIELSAKLKDGSLVEGSGGTFECDVETGAINGMYSSSGPLEVPPRFLLTAANLAYLGTGQKLYDTGFTDEDVSFAQTETRTYLGASRIVNIFTNEHSNNFAEGNETAQWTSENTLTETDVFDKVSGILLEAKWDSKQTSPKPFLNLEITSELVDTNIFEVLPVSSVSPAPSSSIPEFPAWTVAVLIVTISAVGLFCLKRRRIARP